MSRVLWAAANSDFGGTWKKGRKLDKRGGRELGFMLPSFICRSYVGGSASQEKESTTDNQTGTVPEASATPMRPSATSFFADGLPEAAFVINRPRMLGLEEFGVLAEYTSVSGHGTTEEVLDTSAGERTQLYKVLADRKAGRARLLKKMLDSKAPLAATEPKRTAAFRDIDISASKASASIGEMLRPGEGAADIS